MPSRLARSRGPAPTPAASAENPLVEGGFTVAATGLRQANTLELGLMGDAEQRADQSNVEDSAPQSANSFGEQVVACLVTAPTAIMYLWLAQLRWYGQAEVADSAGAVHIVGSRHTFNALFVWISASLALLSMPLAHSWVTLSAIARRHKLDHSGSVADRSYASRLEAAEQESRVVRKDEWAHIVFFGLYWAFAAFVVFPMNAFGNVVASVCLGIVPGASTAHSFYAVTAPARATILLEQRVNSVAFAGGALKASALTLVGQLFVVTRFGNVVLVQNGNARLALLTLRPRVFPGL